jgi:hypothetical protein
MPLCLDFYVLHLHVCLVHERHQIPSDKLHTLDDEDVHPLSLVPQLMMMIIGLISCQQMLS